MQNIGIERVEKLNIFSTHNLTLPTVGNPVMKQNFVYTLCLKKTAQL